MLFTCAGRRTARIPVALVIAAGLGLLFPVGAGATPAKDDMRTLVSIASTVSVPDSSDTAVADVATVGDTMIVTANLETQAGLTNAAAPVTVTFQLPASLTYVSSSTTMMPTASCTPNGQEVTCVSSGAPSSIGWISLTTTATAAGPFDASATASYAPDPNTANNTGTGHGWVVAQATPHLEFVVNRSSATGANYAGTWNGYSVYGTNRGNTLAHTTVDVSSTTAFLKPAAASLTGSCATVTAHHLHCAMNAGMSGTCSISKSSYCQAGSAPFLVRSDTVGKHTLALSFGFENGNVDPTLTGMSASVHISAINFTGNVRANAVRGTSAADTMRGMGGADRLFGLGGNDRLAGDAGNDLLDGGTGTDALSGGAGNDVVHARDGVRDVVTCGLGTDIAVVDRRDVVIGCESVRRA